MLLLERGFSDLMLLGMMCAAKTDAPLVCGLESDPAIGAGTHMRAFDIDCSATPHAAAVSANPSAVRRI
jgi:hypothetical protein